MIDSILDLLDNVPNPIQEGMIVYFDGCDWTLIQMPEAGMQTCLDVQSCIDWTFLSSVLSLHPSLTYIAGQLAVDIARVDANINVVWAAPNLTVGSTTVDLSDLLSQFSLTFNDGSNNFSVTHLDTVVLEGLDGLRFLATAPNRLQVGLPTGAANMQVLTRDADLNVAYWDNNQCCAQTLTFDPVTNVLCISGTNCVDLTSINTDNQELQLAGNILSITQLGAAPQSVDLTNVNEHTLQLTGHNTLEILGSDGVVNATVDLINSGPHDLVFNNTTNTLELQNDNGDVMSSVVLDGVNNQTLVVQNGVDPCADGWVQVGITNYDGLGGTQWIDIPAAPIQCCDDVMACPGVVAMLSDIANLFNLAASLQTQITAIQQQIP